MMKSVWGWGYNNILLCCAHSPKPVFVDTRAKREYKGKQNQNIFMTRYITKEGEQKLKEELEYLKTTKRKELAERLQKAIAFGDLSENFDYSNTKEEQGFVEARVAEIEHMLKNSEVVEQTLQSEKVAIGSTVTLVEGNESSVFTITGPQEANPLEGKLSAESPLGIALLGKKKGEKVAVETPGGVTEYLVKSIS